jgi:hypothetical protein
VFTTRPLSEQRFEIVFEYDVFAAKKLLVQLPLILFHDSRIQVDGRKFEGDSLMIVEEAVLIFNPTTSTRIKISVPAKHDVAIRPPIEPLRWYGGEHPDQRYVPFYGISLLSLDVDSPNGRGMGKFVLEILKE